MTLLFTFLTSQMLIALSYSLPHLGDAAPPLTLAGKLTVQERQKRGLDARIVAVFQSADGDGIKFKTSRNSLLLTTADEQTTLAKVSDFPLAIQSYGESGKATYFQLKDDAFISSNDKIYSVRGDYGIERAMLESYPLTHPDLVAIMQGEVLESSQAAIQASAEQLVAHPAMRLLEPAARALSEELDITGKDEPASMLFFASAMRLSQLYEKSHRSSSRAYRHTTPRSNPFLSAVVQQDLDCLSTCPPCPSMECLGLCGRECSCWRFVCGDCCYHRGCFLHDTCCNRRGFFHHRCLFPTGLSCSSFSC